MICCLFRLILFTYLIVVVVIFLYVLFFFFFFKQKTAYEMRISDWSSDVCSSDLPRAHVRYAGCLEAADRRGLQDRAEHSQDAGGRRALTGRSALRVRHRAFDCPS